MLNSNARRAAAAVLCLTIVAGCSQTMETTVAPGSVNYQDANAAAARDAPSPRIKPITHLAAGQMLERNNDLKGAIVQYEKAVAANPRFATAYNRLGIAYQKLGQLPEAERFFRQGLEVDPGNAVLHNNLGYCRMLRGRDADAERSFQSALAIDPKFERARMNLGIVLTRSGRIDAGLTEFARVVPPEQAYVNVGIICRDGRNYAMAEKAFRRAAEIDPSLPGLQDQIRTVSRLAQAASTEGAPPAAGPSEAPSAPVPDSTVRSVPVAGTEPGDDPNRP